MTGVAAVELTNAVHDLRDALNLLNALGETDGVKATVKPASIAWLAPDAGFAWRGAGDRRRSAGGPGGGADEGCGAAAVAAAVWGGGDPEERRVPRG